MVDNDKSSKDINDNNGLLTKVWGPALWRSLFCIAFGYPKEIDENNEDHMYRKKKYKLFFESLADVLPCIYCRNSYHEFIEGTKGNAELTDEVFKNRENITKWVTKVHKEVNDKLGVDYGVDYEDIKDIYESFRAKCVKKDQGCTMPLNLKVESYVKADIRFAPIVPYDFAKCFVGYAESRGFPNYGRILERNNVLLTSKNWKAKRNDRDVECRKIIDYMRKSAICCVEEDGKYKGLPTETELALLCRRCSSISYHNFNEIKSRVKIFNDL